MLKVNLYNLYKQNLPISIGFFFFCRIVVVTVVCWYSELCLVYLNEKECFKLMNFCNEHASALHTINDEALKLKAFFFLCYYVL